MSLLYSLDIECSIVPDHAAVIAAVHRLRAHPSLGAGAAPE